jgi:hypothetical protein
MVLTQVVSRQQEEDKCADMSSCRDPQLETPNVPLTAPPLPTV